MLHYTWEWFTLVTNCGSLPLPVPMN